MKRVLLAMVAIAATFAATAANDLKWVDGTSLNIYGHTLRNAQNPYSRIEVKPYGFTNKSIIRYSRYSSGLYVMFKTNSARIAVEWSVAESRVRDNMTPIVQMGVDLYAKERGGEWRFAAVGRVKTSPKVTTYNRRLVSNMEQTEKEFMLYLPLWSEITDLKIGVDKDATIEAIPSPYKHRVVTYGTSTLHAASPSRPGLAPLARLSRMLGVDFVNFSYSGQGKMEPESAEVLADCKTDAIICYCFGNTSPRQIEERVDGFVESVAKAHPDKAIIFLPPLLNGKNLLDLKKRERAIAKREILNRKMHILTKKFKNVYYIDIPDADGGDAEASIDNSHPNDLGFDRILQSYAPKIAKILKKYGIKTNKL